MSRSISLKKKFPKVDLKYNSVLITILLNKILKSGKSYLAKRIVYKTLEFIKIKTNKNPLYILEKAIKIIKPKLEFNLKKIENIDYQIPVIINNFKSINIAIRWIISFAKKRSEKGISLQLANELIDCTKKLGNTFKKKEEIKKKLTSVFII